VAKIKVIQVNIFKGKYLDSLVDFLKKEDADFVTMQEVSTNVANYYDDKTLDLFEFIKEKLHMNGTFFKMVEFFDAPDAGVGNAVLSKFPIVNSKKIVLHKYKPISLATYDEPKYFPYFARIMVDATADIGSTKIHVLSTHGAWTAPPTDTPETLRQAELIASYLKTLDAPFIIGGDMNTTSDKLVIKIIEKAAVNLLDDSGIEYTTHPTMHKIAPRKLAVDYIFTSKEFKRISIEAPVVVVSDHLPVIAELEIVS